MLKFREIELSDQEWIQEILNKCDYMSCEYSFGNHFIWKKTYDIKIAECHGFYIAALHEKDGISFLYPAGTGNVKPVIEELLTYCEENDYAFKMHSLLAEKREELENNFPGKFKIEANRDLADYVYRVDDLVQLSGKKYHGKRNHIKRFKDNNWLFEPITKENIQECLEMNQHWCEMNNCAADPEKREECCAVKRAFRYFEELNFFGGLLRMDDKVVAYTIGERLNSNTLVVHVEKAFSDIQGAYPTINQEFLANMATEYEYVNREEDLGVPGLRKAKLSYQPAILLEKYSVTLQK